MNRFQITADIDATVWLGVLEDFQYAPMNIDYEKLKEFFSSLVNLYPISRRA